MNDKRFDRETMAREEEAHIDALLREARANAPEPTAGFMARVMDDALEVQRGFAPPRAERQSRAGVIESLRTLFGGWGAVGGLVTAGLAGLWIGFMGAQQVDTVASGYWQQSENLGTVNLLPEVETVAYVDEGGF
ncbi:dihydroorotate dehydrogenase [Thioclava sp. BHET1]|nr:dihydroorotate dehydrogenase [Thioclava sp. BHET1]